MKRTLPACFAASDGFHGAALGKDAVRIVEADDFVMLQQVDVVRLEPLQGFIDLAGGGFLGAAIDLGHQERLLPVAALRSALPIRISLRPSL